jgi:hypothetical protein
MFVDLVAFASISTHSGIHQIKGLRRQSPLWTFLEIEMKYLAGDFDGP